MSSVNRAMLRPILKSFIDGIVHFHFFNFGFIGRGGVVILLLLSAKSRGGKRGRRLRSSQGIIRPRPRWPSSRPCLLHGSRTMVAGEVIDRHGHGRGAGRRRGEGSCSLVPFGGGRRSGVSRVRSSVVVVEEIVVEEILEQILDFHAGGGGFWGYGMKLHGGSRIVDIFLTFQSTIVVSIASSSHFFP